MQKNKVSVHLQIFILSKVVKLNSSGQHLTQELSIEIHNDTIILVRTVAPQARVSHCINSKRGYSWDTSGLKIKNSFTKVILKLRINLQTSKYLTR